MRESGMRGHEFHALACRQGFCCYRCGVTIHCSLVAVLKPSYATLQYVQSKGGRRPVVTCRRCAKLGVIHE